MVVTDNSKDLIDRVSGYLPEDATELIGRAYFYADECHRGQMRKSGEPYIAHPLGNRSFLGRPAS